MARSLPTGINTQTTAQGAFPGVLVEVSLTSQTLRLCSLDTGYTFGGFFWQAADIEVAGLSWDGDVARAPKLTVGDVDLVFWSLALNLQLQDSRVRVWQCYAGATNEAEPIYSGRIAECRRNGTAVDLALTNDSETQTAPRVRIQSIVAPVFLLPPGTVINVAGQRWILERSKQ